MPTNKEVRKAKKYKRIEKRKGLKEGEGKKIVDNRKQRRREILHAPPEGQEGFTGKYEGAKIAQQAEVKNEAEDTATQATVDAVSAKLGANRPDPYKHLIGGGINTTQPSEDRVSHDQNSLALYKKRMGY